MKAKRHAKILEIIKRQDIETQEELSDMLNQEGFKVTQATVSRDIRELKLTKISVGLEHQKYTVFSESKLELDEKYIRIFKDGTISAELAQSFIVVKTVSGMAMAVAAALDAMNFIEIVGSIAGDDTIMCATRSLEDAERLQQKLRKVMSE